MISKIKLDPSKKLIYQLEKKEVLETRQKTSIYWSQKLFIVAANI